MRGFRCLVAIAVIVSSFKLVGKCVGRFVNPATDICWSCLFPITIGGFKVSPSGEDTDNPRQFICLCGTPIPRVGIPISFWEPVRMIDVTRTKFCMVNMGGISIGGDSVRGHGTVDKGKAGGRKRSFYQVHYYIYPVIYWLELLVNFGCLDTSGFDVAYITEIISDVMSTFNPKNTKAHFASGGELEKIQESMKELPMMKNAGTREGSYINENMKHLISSSKVKK